MRVLILDNDGVICLSNNWGSRTKKWANYRSENRYSSKDKKDVPVQYRFDDFDKKAIKILNEIIEETDCEIVVSSDWRYYADLSELQEYYTSQGIIKAPIDLTSTTEKINPKLFRWLSYTGSLEMERFIEVKDWLDKHPEVTHWVAVDDLDMSVDFLSDRFTHVEITKLKPGLTNFVHTPLSSEGIKQCGVKDKIIKFLS